MLSDIARAGRLSHEKPDADIISNDLDDTYTPPVRRWKGDMPSYPDYEFKPDIPDYDQDWRSKPQYDWE